MERETGLHVIEYVEAGSILNVLELDQFLLMGIGCVKNVRQLEKFMRLLIMIMNDYETYYKCFYYTWLIKVS